MLSLVSFDEFFSVLDLLLTDCKNMFLNWIYIHIIVGLLGFDILKCKKNSDWSLHVNNWHFSKVIKTYNCDSVYVKLLIKYYLNKHFSFSEQFLIFVLFHQNLITVL